jgi:Tol biopolymer transport system component
LRNRFITFLLAIFVLGDCGCEKDNVIPPPSNWELSGKIIFNVGYGSIYSLDMSSPLLALTTLASGGEPRVSPDGRTIVYDAVSPQGRLDIYVVSVTGGTATNLTNNPVHSNTDSWPDWSPDGNSIVFNRVHFPSTKEALYVMNKDGSNLHALTDTSSLAVAFMPRWSPDGSKIAFIGRVELIPVGETKYSLYTTTPDGLMELLADQPALVIPRWSPDSRQIAYGRTFHNLGDTTGGVYVVDVVTKVSQKIDWGSTPSFLDGFSWLPDGTLICVARNAADTTYVVFVSSRSSSANQKILVTGFKDIPTTCPSPDGRFITIFGQRKDDAALTVYIVGADGTNFRKLKDTGISGHITDYYYAQWIK